MFASQRISSLFIACSCDRTNNNATKQKTLLALGNGSPDLGSTINAILLWNESADEQSTNLYPAMVHPVAVLSYMYALSILTVWHVTEKRQRIVAAANRAVTDMIQKDAEEINESTPLGTSVHTYTTNKETTVN